MHRLRYGDRRRRRATLTDPRDIVRAGYDAVAAAYAEMVTVGNPAADWVRDLDQRLPEGAEVLELGCGAGTPGAVVLARRRRYVGVDISRAQIERARRRVRGAKFVVADYTSLDVPAGSLDAVAAILTLTHVARSEHAEVLERIASWLRPKGWLLASLGVDDADDEIQDDWLGAPMFFSHFDADTNRRLVLEAGFELVRDEIVDMHEEPHGDVRFLWVLARKP